MKRKRERGGREGGRERKREKKENALAENETKVLVEREREGRRRRESLGGMEEGGREESRTRGTLGSNSRPREDYLPWQGWRRVYPTLSYDLAA